MRSAMSADVTIFSKYVMYTKFELFKCFNLLWSFLNKHESMMIHVVILLLTG